MNIKEIHITILLISVLLSSTFIKNYKNITSDNPKKTSNQIKDNKNSIRSNSLKSRSGSSQKWMKRYQSGIHFEFNPPK
jgi:hypothetical protein